MNNREVWIYSCTTSNDWRKRIQKSVQSSLQSHSFWV